MLSKAFQALKTVLVCGSSLLLYCQHVLQNCRCLEVFFATVSLEIQDSLFILKDTLFILSSEANTEKYGSLLTRTVLNVQC